MQFYGPEMLTCFNNLKLGFVTNSDKYVPDDIAKKAGLDRIATLNQIHSDYIHKVTTQKRENQEGDSLYTDTKGMGVGVYTADCLPIIYYAEQLNIVGAIHAGWRGTHQEIAGQTFKLIIIELKCDSSSIHVVIGPCIEGNCYEVGDDVAGMFKNKFEKSDLFLTQKNENKFNLNLVEANILQIKNAGVTNISTSGGCTYCDKNLPSYRRDGEGAGRILSFIGMV